MKFLKLAWRNIFRNYRRSLITSFTIIVGVSALIFIWGYVDGINEQMIENSTRYLSGHLQIHQKGYHEERALYLALEYTDDIRTMLLKEPHLESIAPRLEDKALISRGDKSMGIIVVGIDPEEEAKITTLSLTVKKGKYLASGDKDAILLGDKTAKILNASINDEVVLITQASDGSIGAGRYRVKGVFDTGIDMIDGAYVFLPINTAQELYVLPGRVTALAARLDSRQASSEVSARLGVQLGPSYEVLGWKELLPSVVASAELHEVVAYIILIVVFLVVGVGITNTILMAVMERTREFGVMMALGTKRGQIILIVLYEAMLLGLFGLLLGNIIGVTILLYFAKEGIDLGQYVRAMETMPGLSGLVYPLLRIDRLLVISGLVFIVGLAASFYPAWRASRLRPVEAIRGIERTMRISRPYRSKKEAVWHTRHVFLKISVRAIARNPRRSILAVSAMTLGLGSFLFLYAFADGFFEQMIETSTGYITGHLQIQHKRFQEEISPEFSISEPGGLLARIRLDPRVLAAALRVEAKAMVSSPVKSEGIHLFGIDPVEEQKITILHRAIKKGRYLMPGNDREILLGRKLVERLGIELGEKVVVLVQASDGTLGSAAFIVGGIFETENQLFDGSIGFTTLKAGQALLSLGGQASSIVVKLREREEVELAAASLKGMLSGSPYVLITWKGLLPEVVQMMELSRMNINVILMIVFVVVALGVMNTLLMSVMERTREFGVMMALGTRPSQILKLVLYESMFLGLIGMAAGYAMGAAFIYYLGSSGIDLSVYTERNVTIPGLTGVIYPRLIPAHVLIPSLILFLTSIAAAIYPALRAARLAPVSAIRHV